MHRFEVGNVECVVLNTGRFNLNAETLMGNAPPPARAAACEQYGLDPAAIVFQMNPLVVRTDQHLVVIDPGTAFDARGTLITALAAAGIHPEQITGVIITHGHSDHFNGCVNEDGTPAFPNAPYYIQRAEWDHWFADVNPEPHHAASFQAILGPHKDRMVFLEGDGAIISGFEAVLTPGHSPGHMVVVINQQIICVGDVLQHEVYVGNAAWVGTFDCWPEQVIRIRQALLRRIVDENLLVSTYHFAPPGIGHVVPAGDSYRWLGDSSLSG